MVKLASAADLLVRDEVSFLVSWSKFNKLPLLCLLREDLHVKQEALYLTMVKTDRGIKF
jgi:hypothetical protein